MTYPQGAAQWLGLTFEGAGFTIIATTAMYLIFLCATRILGQRLLASLTTFDTLMALLFGSIVARTALGPVPTLTTGVIAFTTLITLHFLLGKFTNTKRGDLFFNRPPVLLMAGSEILSENLKRTNTTPTELASVLRERGYHSHDEIAAVILEPSGKLSVLNRTSKIDPAMLTGIPEAERIPAEFIRG